MYLSLSINPAFINNNLTALALFQKDLIALLTGTGTLETCKSPAINKSLSKFNNTDIPTNWTLYSETVTASVVQFELEQKFTVGHASLPAKRLRVGYQAYGPNWLSIQLEMFTPNRIDPPTLGSRGPYYWACSQFNSFVIHTSPKHFMATTNAFLGHTRNYENAVMMFSEIPLDTPTAKWSVQFPFYAPYVGFLSSGGTDDSGRSLTPYASGYHFRSTVFGKDLSDITATYANAGFAYRFGVGSQWGMYTPSSSGDNNSDAYSIGATGEFPDYTSLDGSMNGFYADRLNWMAWPQAKDIYLVSEICGPQVYDLTKQSGIYGVGFGSYYQDKEGYLLLGRRFSMDGKTYIVLGPRNLQLLVPEV